MGVSDKYFDGLKDGEVQHALDKEGMGDLHPFIAELINYIWKKADNQDRPKRKDIAPKEMQPLLPTISIFDIIYENGVFKDLQVRLQGTEVVAAYGEVTGSKISEYSIESVRVRMLDDCKLVVDTKEIIVGSASSLHEEKSFIKLVKVYIPLFDDAENKDKVTQIISLVKFSS